MAAAAERARRVPDACFGCNVTCTLIKIEDELGRRDVDKRKLCHVCWDLHKKRYKTQLMCSCHQNGLCGPTSGRTCFDVHDGNHMRGAASQIIPDLVY